MKKLILTLAIVALVAGNAYAIPELQIYIEGATFDALTETWVVNNTGSLRLWAVANVGAKGPIDGVKLSAAYSSAYAPTFSITGSTTGGYNGFVDPSAAANPTYVQTVTDGSAPVLGDGSSLPSHGIYGTGTYWQEFALGDFTLTDSYITDFNGSTDSPVPGSAMGQINVYDVNIAGVPLGGTVHFDLYDHYYNKQGAQYTFAPFSHDGETTNVPEPGTIALLGMGIAGLGYRMRRRVKK